jgi:nucleotide-binding universal stress UspA family protein
LKTFLVHADRRPTLRARLDTAKALAARRGGHIVVLIDTPLMRYFAADPLAGGGYYPEAMHEVMRGDDALAAEIHEELAATGLSFEVLRAEAEPGAMLAHLARLADLVILSRDCGCAGDVAFHARAPVLLLGNGAPLPVPVGHACIAWDGSDEAALAMRYAMPLLAECAQVSVLSIDSKGRDFALADAERFLARNGIHARIHDRRHHGPVGESLAVDVRECGGDLLVMGAYGHSRLRGFLLGGVTSYFVEDADRPALLLAH